MILHFSHLLPFPRLIKLKFAALVILVLAFLGSMAQKRAAGSTPSSIIDTAVNSTFVLGNKTLITERFGDVAKHELLNMEHDHYLLVADSSGKTYLKLTHLPSDFKSQYHYFEVEERTAAPSKFLSTGFSRFTTNSGIYLGVSDSLVLGIYGTHGVKKTTKVGYLLKYEHNPSNEMEYEAIFYFDTNGLLVKYCFGFLNP